VIVWVIFVPRLYFWQHRREDLQSQILLVTQSICPPLDDADLVVESLDETEGNLVLGFAIGGDPLPMTLDHLGKLLIGLEALPLETGLPVLEESPRPALSLVAPQLAEGFLEQVGRVELDDAKSILSSVYSGFTEGFGSRDLIEAKTVLEQLMSSL